MAKNAIFSEKTMVSALFSKSFSKKSHKYLIGTQCDKKILQNFSKNRLPVCKKVVLLHPLSEGERGETRGEPGAKFFESLRPAQDQRHWEAARGKEPLTKEHQENIKAEPEIQRKI